LLQSRETVVFSLVQSNLASLNSDQLVSIGPDILSRLIAGVTRICALLILDGNAPCGSDNVAIEKKKQTVRNMLYT
jgi:hypothetical protein